jgi:membrane-bound inhibitor of C-type lysozyme
MLQAVAVDATVYQCKEGKLLEVEYSQGAAQVKFTGQGSVLLKQIPSASGARYSNNRITLFTKGTGAFVEVNGRRVLEQCRALDVRDRYQSVDLKTIPPENLRDQDPKIAVIKAFGQREAAQPEGLKSESLDISYSRFRTAVATMIVDGVADDSIQAKKYRVEMILKDNQWVITWAGIQLKCHTGRGHNDWSAQRCL